MILGVDFDNTIVSYDALFHRVAVDRGLIPADLPPRKNDVRDFLRNEGRENDWTELQGYVYGPRMTGAQPFPGVMEFFQRAAQRGIPLHIISHKTRKAVLGPAYDLQQTAREWLAAQGFHDPQGGGVPVERVHFGETRAAKIAHIRAAGCTVFIDDLEETFLEADFPPGVRRILFGASAAPGALPGVEPAPVWAAVTRHVFPG
jgi:hypothetical protein